MPFKKGDANINRSGRPKESDISKKHVDAILITSLKYLRGKVKELTINQQLKLVSTLIPYVLPRLQAMELTNEEDFDKLSNDQLESIVNNLLDRYVESK